MFLNLLIISTILIAISLVGLGIRMLIEKGGRFPETEVGKNAEMKKLGISCGKSIDIGCKPSPGISGCTTCGGGSFE